ncbi:PREDICTED: zinc finger matrin-type protein 1-like [Nanorana parkeri]|uniref:zinc finger matrin-type protein 1-like n=1 Tax=Nanorana parkeri TaxID=125878 RepID=UPI00085424D7|nr:PREDICTED: zinc finger matrin-type protein 1-like [Nanorana parkeri]
MASEGAIIPQLVESITQKSSPSAATCSVPMAGGDISSSAQTTIPCQTEIVLDERTKRELFTDTFCRVCGAVLQFESHRNAHYEGKRHAQKVRLYFLNKELEEMAYKKKVDQKTERMNFHVDQQLAQDKNKFCSLCNMVFSSPVVAQSHYVGKIHAKKLKQLSGETSEWTPEADSSMTSEAAVPPVSEQDAVMSSLSEKSNQQEASTETSSADNEIDLSDPNKYCKLCCASFNNPLVAQQHYNGKKHARNELRRKMMEEMEDTGMSVDTGAGDGVYVCPICSITLTSIEMYQSHMQGNKHQIKENIVAHLMKSTKKNYDSFENELEDYIKVQKARGLEPKTQFRPEKDQQDSPEEIEPAPPPHPNPNPAAYNYFGHKPMPYQAYNPIHKSNPRMPAWEPNYWPQRPARMPIKIAPPRKHLPSSPDSSDSSSSSDDSSGSYKREKRHKREHRNKERKHHSKSKRGIESSERKKRKVEETDSGKEDSEKEKKSDAVPVDKSKHKKEKKDKPSTDKESSKKHKKPKKVQDQRTEEEILWDESILGF